MTLLTTAFLWLLQSTAAGLVALALPRLFRLTSPRWLTAWWSVVAGAVVLLPLAIALVPDAPAGQAVVSAVVESTAAALVPAAPVLVIPIGVLLLVGWIAGALARVGWLLMGARRLRRLIEGGVPVVDDALADAERLADVRVPYEVRQVAGVGPCAVGRAPVRVIVPPTLRQQPYEQRRSVYLHELLHVARGDVQRTWGDEAWRAIWWWQPAVWWALARLRLAREQAVDAHVVRLAGGMRDYVDALVWCSTQPSTSAATLHAGGRRHVLVRRVALMCKEESMSRWRGALVTGAMMVVLGTLTGAMAHVAPLDVSPVLDAQDQSGGAGTLEQAAVRPTLDVPAPRRVRAVAPVWTAPAGSAFSVRVNAVVDAAGRVAEARVLGTVSASKGGNQWPIAPAEAHVAVLDAVRQWEFEAPLQAPMLITTDVVLGDAALLMADKVTQASQRPQGPQGMQAAQPMQAKILRAGGPIPPPRKVYDVPPIYPAAAMDAKVQGVVVVECTVGTDGTVTDTTVVQSIPLLDQAAVESVRQWRYTPTLLNGEPVPVIVTVSVNFTLK
jgi:TonB family protein